MIGIFPPLSKPWASWGGVLRNVTLVVGVVVLEIPVLFLPSTARKIFGGGEPWPTFNVTSLGV